MHKAGYSWQKSRSWQKTGQAIRKRKSGTVTVTDADTVAKQTLIERASRMGSTLGLEVWNADEAGPFQTVPLAGSSWQPKEHPKRFPREYERHGTAKMLTLFHPRTGEVRVKGVSSVTNVGLHQWLKEQLTAIVADLPEPSVQLSSAENRAKWRELA